MNDKPTINPQTLPPLTRFIYTLGQLPTSYLMSMSFEEQLVWLCNYLGTQVIPAVNQNGEAVEELQNLYELLRTYVNDSFDNLNVQEEINNKLDEMVEDGTLENIIEEYITNDFIEKVNNFMNPIELGGFVAILNSSSTGTLKTDEQIKTNISDLVDSKVKDYNLICEIMPNSTDKAGYEGGTLSINDITFECYPDISTLNTYIDYAKEQGIDLHTLKFHSLWAKEHLSSNDYITFITKYGNVLLSILNALNNKPKYATILNEFYSIFNNSTISSITSLLTSIKNLDIKAGLCGITNEIITYNLGNNVDAIFPHFYPYATMKGEDATIQDVYEGIERSKTGEKVLLRLHKLYPDKDIIISEVGASSYWEALAQPERYWGNVSGATFVSNGMPMALYAKGALKYYSQFDIKGLFVFWTDTIPKYLKEFYLDYFERGEI